jgi:hypothetical protein
MLLSGGLQRARGDEWGASVGATPPLDRPPPPRRSRPPAPLAPAAGPAGRWQPAGAIVEMRTLYLRWRGRRRPARAGGAAGVAAGGGN